MIIFGRKMRDEVIDRALEPAVAWKIDAKQAPMKLDILWRTRVSLSV